VPGLLRENDVATHDRANSKRAGWVLENLPSVEKHAFAGTRRRFSLSPQS